MSDAEEDARLEHAGAVMAATFAQLVSEPFALPMSQIARLTDRQIAEVYFHGRDGQGKIIPPKEPAAAPLTEAAVKAEFLTVCTQLGMSLGAAEQRWEAERARRKGGTP